MLFLASFLTFLASTAAFFPRLCPLPYSLRHVPSCQIPEPFHQSIVSTSGSVITSECMRGIHRVAIELDWLVSDMKKFISEDWFDFQNFDLSAWKFSKTLENLESKILVITCSEKRNLYTQFKFANFMLSEMRLASQEQGKKSTGRRYTKNYASSLVNLYVWLFKLHDNRGLLDKRIPSYQNKVIISWQAVYKWTEELNTVDDYPREQKIVFIKYRRKTLLVLERLWAQFIDE